LVKSTLASRQFGDIRASTRGIIFLGTPHHGSSTAKYGEMLAKIAKAVGRGADTKLIHTLRKDSPELMKLARSFTDIYDDMDIFCFYELLPVKFSNVVCTVSTGVPYNTHNADIWLPGKIVSQPSATIPGKPSDGLNAHHTNMNQYTDSSDPNFAKFASVLCNMLRTLRASKGEVNGQFVTFMHDSAVANPASRSQ
jgi:hypothetical protein